MYFFQEVVFFKIFCSTSFSVRCANGAQLAFEQNKSEPRVIHSSLINIGQSLGHFCLLLFTFYIMFGMITYRIPLVKQRISGKEKRKDGPTGKSGNGKGE